MAESQSLRVIPWSDTYALAGKALLEAHKDTSMFLLNNLEECGPCLGESFNSGDFKCLLNGEKIVAVFALTKMGNILMQTDRMADYSSYILESCLKENITIKGCVAAWELAEPVWRRLVGQFPQIKTNTYLKDLLYTRSLDDIKPNRPESIRLLEEADFPAWDKMNIAYFNEMGFPQQGSNADRKKAFLQNAKKKHWWGLFVDGVLTSICAYNAIVGDTAQIGGVYTLPEQRRKGFSKQLVQQVLVDSKFLHHLSHMLLFTEEANIAARRVYESLGFTHKGYFGLIFGD